MDPATQAPFRTPSTCTMPSITAFRVALPLSFRQPDSVVVAGAFLGHELRAATDR